MSASRILRTNEVLKLIPVSRMTLTRWRKEGKFPEPIALGPNAVGWREADVEAWIDANDRSRN